MRNRNGKGSCSGQQIDGTISSSKGVSMLRPTVIKAIPKDDYKLLLEFDNGEKKSFDVTPYIKGSWFGKLHDKPYFSSVKANGFNIEWPDGQDICPDDLYYNSVESTDIPRI